MKRFGKRARITVTFSDDTSESFSMPLTLVSRIAPVVRACYPGWTLVQVEHGARTLSATHAERGRFAARLREMFGGGHMVGPGACPYCGSCPP